MTIAIKFKPTSMLERIKKANNTDELVTLIRESRKYIYASEKTCRKWGKAARARAGELALKADEKQKKEPKGGKRNKRG